MAGKRTRSPAVGSILHSVSEQPEAANPPELRASDADRERVARILHQAMSEGRLSTEELDERLGTLYASKTLRELEPLTADLPTGSAPTTPAVAPQRTVSTDRMGGVPSGSSSVAILSGASRKGDWVMPGRYTAVAVMGGVDLDLTDVRFSEPDPVINVLALMGGVEITVPDDINVRVDVAALMGGVDNKVQGRAPADAPTVRITGLVLMAGVDIKPPKRRRRDRGQIEE
jgi:hypothetical protein